MSKKILGICAALVALAALAIPASSSAAVTLRDTVSGVPTSLAVGAKITALSDEHAIFEAGGGTVTCNENWMTGEVHVNNGTEITGTITAAKFQGTQPNTHCSSNILGNTTVDIPVLDNKTGDWCIKNIPGLDEFEVLGRGCTESGNGTLTFILTGEALTCRYTRSEGVRGEFTTTSHPNAATLKVTGEPVFTKHESSFLCPTNGKITKMAFNLYTDKATESESTANPISIDDVS